MPSFQVFPSIGTLKSGNVRNFREKPPFSKEIFRFFATIDTLDSGHLALRRLVPRGTRVDIEIPLEMNGDECANES